MTAASPTGGVKPMAIAGRMVRERERLLGMTPEETQWRKQWLKDQVLSPNEPRRVPALDAEFTNPIRRFYRAPLDALAKSLEPTLGFNRAFAVRFWIGKALLVMTGVYAGVYYFKYNQNDWTRKGGWRVIQNRPVCHPGDPEFPKLSDRSKPEDYAARGFKTSAI